MKRSYSRTLGPRFDQTLRYAHRVHRNQKRKGTRRPYIGHLLGVTSITLQYGGDEDQAIAALLHDAVEDCGGRPRLEEIRRKFGPRVGRIVEGCTDSFETPKPPWMERKRAYLRHVQTARRDVILVSAADKLSNVREILADYREMGEALWLRFTGGRKGTLWYYRALARAFQDRAPAPLANELMRVTAQLERLTSRKPSPANHRGKARPGRRRRKHGPRPR